MTTIRSVAAHPAVAPALAGSAGLDGGLFVLLAFIWGSSYLFIKIGIDAGIPPLTLVMFRLLIGAVLLAAVAIATRVRWPREPRAYVHLAVLGFVSMALPFGLISWAEQRVDSTIAAVLSAAIPLFVVLIGSVALRSERLSPGRLAGLGIGFAGVAMLVGLDPARLGGGDLAAELALLAAAASYAVGGIYARRTVAHLGPMVPAVGQVGFGFVIATVVAVVAGSPIVLPARLDAVVAIVWLGLLGSGVAYLLFFRLLGRWGATRTSMVAYVMPVFGLVLGAAVLGEPVDGRLVVGTALVLAGVVVVNAAIPWRSLAARLAGLGRAPAPVPAGPATPAGDAA